MMMMTMTKMSMMIMMMTVVITMIVRIVIERFTLRITVDQDFVKDMIVASWGWNHWVSCIVTYLDVR